MLGNALSTEIVVTMNLRTLREFLEKRATNEADAEIRALAVAMHTAALPYCHEWLAEYQQYPAPDGLGVCLRSTAEQPHA